MGSENLIRLLENLLTCVDGNRLKSPYQYLDEAEIAEIKAKCEREIVPIPMCSDLLQFLTRNSIGRNRGKEEEKTLSIKELLLNAMCNPKNITNVKNQLLKYYKKK